MMEHVNWIHNIPFFSIFLAMFCGIITPLIKNGKTAHKVHALMVLIVAIMSAILLVNVTTTGESFTFMMGHFPAPWGNELRAGPLEAMMALIFSVVMLLNRVFTSLCSMLSLVPCWHWHIQMTFSQLMYLLKF